MVEPRPADPLNLVLRVPVRDRLDGEREVLRVDETEGVRRDRDDHEPEHRGPEAEGVAAEPAPTPADGAAQPVSEGDGETAADHQRAGDVERLLRDRVQCGHGADPGDRLAAVASHPQQQDQRRRGEQRHLDVVAREPGVVDEAGAYREQHTRPPGCAPADATAQRQGQCDQRDAGERRVQARHRQRLSEQQEQRSHRIEQQRAVVGGIVAVGTLGDEHVGEVGVHRLVVVRRPLPERPHPQQQR